MSLRNQSNTERKKCVWTTKYKRLLEMCIVENVEMKSVFTFQPIKRLVSTTVKIAKPAATFWMFFLHNVLQGRRVATTQKKVMSVFEEIFPPITTKHIRTWTKKGRIFFIYGITVSTPYWLIQLTKTSCFSSFYTLSVYIKFSRNSSGSLELVVVSKTKILDNHLAPAPVTPNQQGAHEKRAEVFSRCRCTQAGIRCLIWTMLISTGKNIIWM